MTTVKVFLFKQSLGCFFRRMAYAYSCDQIFMDLNGNVIHVVKKDNENRYNNFCRYFILSIFLQQRIFITPCIAIKQQINLSKGNIKGM